MNPRIEATAFRIWQYCKPLEWNVTVVEIADALDLPMPTVRNLCAKRGWSNRLRVIRCDAISAHYADLDSAVEEIASNRLGGRSDHDFADRA